MKRFLVIAATLGFGIISLGCSRNGVAGELSKKGPAQTQASADVKFVDQMVPHHAMAIEMARTELDKGSRSDVKALARKILNEQTKESEKMKALRKELTGSDSAPAMGSADMTRTPGMGGMADMSGMTAPSSDMSDMSKVSGVDQDEMFLRMMKPHHEKAVEMFRQMLPELKRHELKDLAKNGLKTQGGEIREIEALQSPK